MADPEDFIRINRLSKRFGDFVAVDDLSLSVRSGEIYGFLGPNGAGKTTTIKMMTGLFAPTSGSVMICGFDVQREALKAKQALGYIPDQPYVYEKLTGREFLHFSAGLYRLDHRIAADRIRGLIDTFEIGPWIDRRAEYYSQGMRQRVIICAALLHKPRVLVIDEPMVGLDPRSAHIVKRVLKEESNAGTAVFMSTHSLPVVEELCDRIAIIKDGRLIFEDTVSAIDVFRKKEDGKFESVFLELTR